MKTSNNRTSIKRIAFLFIAFAGIFAFAFAFLVVFNEKMELKKDIEKAKSEYLQNKKDAIVSQSVKIYKTIEYYQAKGSTQEELKNQIFNIIESIFRDPLEMIYPFVYTDDGTPIYDPVLMRYQDTKLSSLLTKDNKNILKKIFQIGKNGGDFYEFEGFYDNSKKENKNLIFAREVSGLGWIVGTGAYLDDFNSVIEAKKSESDKKISSFILKIATLTIALYLANIMKYNLLANRLSRELKVINNTFSKAAKTYKFIDKKEIQLEEFQTIVAHANSMIETIKINTNKLHELNANLEEIVQDKTSKLQASVELSKTLLKDQDRFINNALHEINTPLSVILMNTELFHLKYDKNPYFQKIQAAVKVLENINEDLNYASKKDRLIYKKQRIDFSSYLHKRVEYFTDVACENELEFVVYIEENISIDFNEVELSRILDNNISNAVKYAYAHTRIEIALKRKQQSIQFSIGNHGETIQNTYNLFKRYYRENESRGGFGLGLNIVKDICEKNEVSIQIESEEEYTTFRYNFPLKA